MITLTAKQRDLFQQLCGVLLPAWEQLPGGSTLKLQGVPLNTALSMRPELLEPLQQFLSELVAPVNFNQLQKKQSDCPDEFKAMKLLVCATYYQHSDVRTALSYHGQQALNLPRGGFGCEELVLKMLSAPKRYR